MWNARIHRQKDAMLVRRAPQLCHRETTGCSRVTETTSFQRGIRHAQQVLSVPRSYCLSVRRATTVAAHLPLARSAETKEPPAWRGLANGVHFLR